MADNDTTVVLANGTTAKLRSYDLGSGVFLQAAAGQALETALRSAVAADHRFTVDSAGIKALVVSGVPGVRFARVRLYHSAQSAILRCYYNTDGAALTNAGVGATGFLLHGEQIVVSLADLTKFRMIGESALGATSFEAYVEFVQWLP